MSEVEKWLVSSRGPGPVRQRLVCVPFAGAGASLFRDWVQGVPAGLEVLRVQLPGRESRSRERACLRMQEVVDPLVEKLGDGPPTALFGHSLGGLIAFELAVALGARAVPLTQLFVSGARPPHVPDPHQLHELSDSQFVDALRARGGIQEEILQQPELCELLLPLIRADLEVAETFVRSEPLVLPMPLTVLAAPADTVIPWEATAAWRGYTRAGFERQAFEGDHFFVREHGEAVRRLVGSRLGFELG